MDFKLDKKIKFAVLSRSRIMIGRNVMISGPIGSRFTETNLANGHPIQMVSDFYGLDAQLDASLNVFYNTLKTNDKNGDNRIDLSNSAETAGITNPSQYDTNHDGYIDEYDFFLARFDANGDGKVSNTELNTASNVDAAQLMQLIDTFGDPTRQGYNDGFIDNNDRYAKIQGQIMMKADLAGWQAGAAGGNYQNYVQGPILPNSGQSPVVFQATDAQLPPIDASSFDMSSFAAMATGNLASQAAAQAAQYSASNPNSPQPLGNTVYESVPYGAAHPYDYYTRPVYTNMTFTNVTIPPGTNALFQNCTFNGCTFVQTASDSSDANFNYVGAQQADGSASYPGLTASVSGTTVADTKAVSNNVRFDGCTFNGAVVTAVAKHLRQRPQQALLHRRDDVQPDRLYAVGHAAGPLPAQHPDGPELLGGAGHVRQPDRSDASGQPLGHDRRRGDRHARADQRQRLDPHDFRAGEQHQPGHGKYQPELQHDPGLLSIVRRRPRGRVARHRRRRHQDPLQPEPARCRTGSWGRSN